ncbi:MAG: Na+/H+ antiporter NhaC [Paraglaciecola sp.]|jgi:Na+/H+ antiporter NhaC
MKQDTNSSFWGLSPIVIFVLMVLLSGVIGQDFKLMPILVAFMLAAAYALAINPGNIRLSLHEKVDIFCHGAGDKTIVLLVFIFLMAGALYALTIDIGARDATVNWALNIIPAKFLLPGLFVICCAISFAMGTSMGTITALAPIGIGLAESLGIPPALALGVVIGGGMFGDNLSFISDTTIAATRTQGVKLKDKFKANLIIALPAALVTLAVLFFIEVKVETAMTGQDYNAWLMLPYLVIIVTALLGINVIVVLGFGILTAAIIGLTNGTFTGWEALQSIQKGIGWMQNLAIIALTIGGIVGLMKAYGGLTWLMNMICARIKSKKGAEFGIASLACLLDLSIANNTISIVTAGPIAKDLSKTYQIDPRRTASLLDIFSCACQGLVPYGGQMLTVSALAGLSPLAITPYTWYPMLLLMFATLAIIFGLPHFKKHAQDDFVTKQV